MRAAVSAGPADLDKTPRGPLRVAAAFGLALVVLLAVGAAAYRSIVELREALAREADAYRVVSAIHAFYAELTTAESSQRAFLITGDDRHVRTFAEAVAAGDRQAGQLKQLLAGDPERSRRADALEALVSRKLVHMAESIRLGRLKAERTVLGAGIMDEIRVVLKEMERAEAAELALRVAESEASGRRSMRVIGYGSGLAVLLVALAGFQLRREIATRQRAQQALARSEELYRRILRDFPHGGVALFDRDLHFGLVEGSGLQQLGLSKQDLEGKTVREALPAETCATLEPHFRAALAGEEVGFEGAYADRLFSAYARPLHGSDGGISHGIVVFLDITASKRSEEEIRRLNRELQENVARLGALNEELEAFSYSVSHDLRAPVRHINGFVDLLRRSAGGSLDADSQRHLETISGAACRMGQLIDNLLAFSRMGRVELQSRPVDLASLVAAVIDEQRGESQARDVDFQASALPQVQGDASILRVVFTNLVSNAVKYSRPRARPRVEIGSQPGASGELVIFVRDNGVGFDMRYADKLFGVFERLHRAAEFEGTGIGLATVRRIVHRHGGRCWAEGVVDGGATFYVSLPPAPRGEA